ncbi:hypothetical protein EXIGLDRAFT_725858 [Exidia glandulosa HHB12029]|uniref:Uncharacterized protein n=1 Tax=Exidia glandulosa HHB12029 TaxID=1314781 RepID=A0A165MGC8_EXIGL|nr:hypothetical protein EXIGLDRAFT_725858 [Exidia glandulosa HHB12029]
MAYLSTAYMPIHENQFLHASVPVRILLASLAGFSWAMKRRRPNQDFYTDSNALIAIAIYDGLGGVVLGWHLGSFDGKIPAYR